MSLVNLFPESETEPKTGQQIPAAAEAADSDPVTALVHAYQDARRADFAARGRPVPNLPVDAEQTILRARLLIETLRDQRRAAHRQYRQIRVTLGLVLLRQRDRSAKGEFKPWLRAHGIPVSSAYVLITRVMANPPGRPPLRLSPRRIQLKLNRWQHATLTHAVEKLQAAASAVDFLALVYDALHASRPLIPTPSQPPTATDPIPVALHAA